MNRRFKILLGILSIIIFGFFILLIFTNDFKRKITVLDCEGVYYKKLFEKPKPGFIDYSEENAKKRIAVCLCEKYLKNRSENYNIEILKLYDEIGVRYSNYEKGNKIDSICKNRKYVFLELFEL